MQKKYWSKLKAEQKVAIMEILLSMLDFAASYNSYTNLSMRIRHVPADRLFLVCVLILIAFDIGKQKELPLILNECYL